MPLLVESVHLSCPFSSVNFCYHHLFLFVFVPVILFFCGMLYLFFVFSRCTSLEKLQETLWWLSKCNSYSWDSRLLVFRADRWCRCHSFTKASLFQRQDISEKMDDVLVNGESPGNCQGTPAVVPTRANIRVSALNKIRWQQWSWRTEYHRPCLRKDRRYLIYILGTTADTICWLWHFWLNCH
jgi:hypothetical protein